MRARVPVLVLSVLVAACFVRRPPTSGDEGTRSVSIRGTVFKAQRAREGESGAKYENSAAVAAVSDSAASDLQCAGPIALIAIGDKRFSNGTGRTVVVDACGERVTYFETCVTIAWSTFECRYQMIGRFRPL